VFGVVAGKFGVSLQGLDWEAAGASGGVRGRAELPGRAVDGSAGKSPDLPSAGALFKSESPDFPSAGTLSGTQNRPLQLGQFA
jgi:hypothetical protein